MQVDASGLARAVAPGGAASAPRGAEGTPALDLNELCRDSTFLAATQENPVAQQTQKAARLQHVLEVQGNSSPCVCSGTPTDRQEEVARPMAIGHRLQGMYRGIQPPLEQGRRGTRTDCRVEHVGGKKKPVGPPKYNNCVSCVFTSWPLFSRRILSPST